MLNALRARIDDRYGTHRGLARLLLSHVDMAVGGLGRFAKVDWERVERFVWVCTGNICRSPYAEYRARVMDLPSVSCGLHTAGGVSAPTEAIEVAAKRGIDLRDHRSTSIADLPVDASDLLVAMEPRQVRALAEIHAGWGCQITLVGLWAHPSRPHLHDPFTLGPGYFDTCYAVIDDGVARMAEAFQASRSAL